jgi:hypothetical protein
MRARDRRGRQDVHVVREAGSRRWTVVTGQRRLSRHRRQATAVRAGVRAARRLHVELVTHGADGRIRSKNSYGYESPRLDHEQ